MGKCKTHEEKRRFRELYAATGCFDWIVTQKIHRESEKATSSSEKTWRTDAQILIAESYTKDNPNQKALAAAKLLMKAVQQEMQAIPKSAHFDLPVLNRKSDHSET